MHLRRLFTALFLLALAARPLHAQTSGPSSAGLALASELLDVMHADSIQAEMMRKALAGYGDIQGAEEMQAIMEEFFEKYLPWSVLEQDFAAAYAAEFTEDELRQLIVFFRTPLGQRWVFGGSATAMRLGEITQEKMMPHMAELQQMIMSRLLQRD